MTEIKGSADCGNSPKNQFVQDLAISIELGAVDPDKLSAQLAWHGGNAEPITGIETFARELTRRPEPYMITIHHAVSHGKVGAACGEVAFENGHTRRFSHVFEFTSARANRVAVIHSYA